MTSYWHTLETLPDGARLSKVTAEPCSIQGRGALRVALAPEVRLGQLGVDFGDFPTFVSLPVTLENGVLEVDMLARLLPDAPDYARGFIGLAYRIQDGNAAYESVYVRPLNGRSQAPPPPRDRRTVQYYAYPDWQFDRLREAYPDGRFECGAEAALDTWMHMRLDIAGRHVVATLNGGDRFVVPEGVIAPAAGAVGLWVDIGTEGYFANVRVTPS